MAWYRAFAFTRRTRPNEKSVCTKSSRDYDTGMNTLACPHCQTSVSEDSRVCRGCGAEIVHGASRRERSLIGVMFVMAAMLITVVLFRSLEIMRGAPPLSAPKAEDGFLFFIA